MVPVSRPMALAGRTRLFEAESEESFCALPVLSEYTDASMYVGVSGSWLISRVYGSMRSLFGSNVFPDPSHVLTSPADEPGVHPATYGQFGPHAR